MEARITPTNSNGYTHNVPGVQAFATIDLIDAEGSKVTVQFHQPSSILEFSAMCNELAHALSLTLAGPQPEEGDAP